MLQTHIDIMLELPVPYLQVEMKVMMETDPSEILNEIIYATRKGGYIGVGVAGSAQAPVWRPAVVCCLCVLPMLIRLSLVLVAVGVYAGYCNHFNIGAFMEKVRLGINL
jgi:hypothetical protein